MTEKPKSKCLLVPGAQFRPHSGKELKSGQDDPPSAGLMRGLPGKQH